MVKVYVLVFSVNMSVGFDVFGVVVIFVDGVLFGDVVMVEVVEIFSFNNFGCFVDKLLLELWENIVYQCWECFCQELGK